MFDDFKRESLIGKAIGKGILEINIYNIRDHSKDAHKSVDDEVYGGGNGMLMTAQPIYDCYKAIVNGNSEINTYYMSPKGKKFDQETAIEMSKEKEINILCGHYEGIDERALKLIKAKELSIGDYVLTGGEIPAMVVIDSVARFIKGVLSNEESTSDESFRNNLLEYPQYTRPYEYEGLKVPDILLSGDHKKVKEYNLLKSIEITKNNRPDLYEKYLKENN